MGPLTDAERARRYRDRQRGGPPRELKPCGTRAAKVRHRRKGEECVVCWPALDEPAEE